MIGFKPKGAIFDVDDTLLDNTGDSPLLGLHEKSRLEATHIVGRRHHLPALENLTAEENHRAFWAAPTHSIQSAVWKTLVICGLREGTSPDLDDPLLKEIIAARMEIHREVILHEGKAYPGAVEFVKALEENGLQNKLAIATSGYRHEIQAFLKKSGLRIYFPAAHLITQENIKHPKPDPEAFNLAFDSLGLPDSDRQFVCAFEDNPRGIKSAQSARLYVCALTTIYKRTELESLVNPPDMIADSFYEFANNFGLHL